jgi:MerR-like DNA binding protein
LQLILTDIRQRSTLGRMLLNQAAKSVGLHPNTILKLERKGLIKPVCRDWNNWRRYSDDDIEALRRLVRGEPNAPRRKGSGSPGRHVRAVMVK